MEPFSIACTTCQARLRVRDESVIGQILTCPKCGSMVLVELPSSTAESPAAPPDTLAAPSAEQPTPPEAASDFADAADMFEAPPAEPAPPTSDSADLSDTVEDLAVQGRGHIAPSREAFSADESTPPPIEDPELSEYEDVTYDPGAIPDRPLLPNEDWTSATTTAWRNRALTGVVCVVGVALAITAFVIFNDGSGSESTDALPSVEVAQVDPGQSPSESQPTVEPPPKEPTPATPSIDEENPAAETPLNERGDTEVPPAGAEAVEEPEAVAGPDPVPEDLDDEPTSPETPPGFTLDPDDKTGEAGAADGSIADTLREFGGLLGTPPEADDPADAESEPEVATTPDEVEGPELLKRPGARVVDVDARLLDPIKALEFDDIPLSKFLRFVSDYSTIPVTLDADMLVWCKISPAKTIDINVQDSTVTEVLEAGLSSVGLSHRVENDQLWVTRRPTVATPLRTVTLRVRDLGGDDPERLQELGGLIMDLVEPDSWKRRGGEGSMSYQGSAMVVEQAEPVLFKTLEFCEKMRVANRLPTKSAYHSSVFRLDSRTSRAAKKLGQPISLTYIRPASFQRIVDRLSEAARIHIVINWQTLAEADWSPDAEVSFSTAGEPLRAALTKLLDPMDLTYRVVSGSVLEITTQEAFDARLELEFYPVAELLEGSTEDVLLQGAQQAVGEDSFRGLGGDCLLKIDARSKCLLASLSQSQQVQLEGWLDKQKLERVAAAGP